MAPRGLPPLLVTLACWLATGAGAKGPGAMADVGEPPAMTGAVEILCADGGDCRLTLLARLAAAPFPFDPGPEMPPDTPRPRGAYDDDRVLVHVPPAYDPQAPSRLLVYFHGHQATLERTVLAEHGIARQVTESGRNIVLVAPQFAVDAIDSHPGKLLRQNGLRDLLSEVRAVLDRELGADTAPLADAPVILAAFSGGYLAAAESLQRGGVAGRIEGLVLFDSFYGAHDRFAAWFAANHQRAFLVALFGESSAPGADRLMAAFREQGIGYGVRWPAGGFRQAERLMVAVDTPHLRIPVDGPPEAPLAEILRRLPPFERYRPAR